MSANDNGMQMTMEFCPSQFFFFLLCIVSWWRHIFFYTFEAELRQNLPIRKPLYSSFNYETSNSKKMYLDNKSLAPYI